MKNKVVIIILSILFIMSTLCCIIGLIENKNREKGPNQEENPKRNIVYEYYLEDELVDEMPKNNISTISDNSEINYIFKRYNCTDNVVLDFDTVNWDFTTSGATEGTCKLYFVNARYNVSITATNGVVDENNKLTVDRETDGSFKVIPNEGYQYKDVACANNKEATWNDKNSTININAITSDIACTVHFEKKELNINVTVKNGLGSTSEKVFYGDAKTILVSPNDGYNSPTITCTNNQTAIYENNNITFEKVTNSTNCIVTFNKRQIPKYKITISNLESFENTTDFEIIVGGKENIIDEGRDFTFTFKRLTDKNIKLNCDVIPSQEKELENNVKNFIFYNVSKNITCNLVVE